MQRIKADGKILVKPKTLLLYTVHRVICNTLELGVLQWFTPDALAKSIHGLLKVGHSFVNILDLVKPAAGEDVNRSKVCLRDADSEKHATLHVHFVHRR